MIRVIISAALTESTAACVLKAVSFIVDGF